MKSKHNPNFETIAVRNRSNDTHFREHSSPLYLNSSFTFESAEQGSRIFSGEEEGYLYSRFSNPTTDEFTQKMALLEGAAAGISTASGMSAVFVSLAGLLKQGDHLIACKSIFGNSTYIITQLLPQWGISYTLVDIEKQAEWESAFQENTKLFFVESPSNPTLVLVDLKRLSKTCREKGAILCVDNTFATPYLQQPIKLGAGLVIHSATKYIDGQGRVLGGAILGSEDLIQTCYDFIRRTGPSISPFNAWILSKSLETLSIRMDRHCDNALKLANYLESHSEVASVQYPFLPSFPQYELAKKQMNQGGGLVACVFKGGKARGQRLLNALQMISLTANLGDTRTIATHPPSTTHSKLNEQQLEEAGIHPGLIRFSVGLEHIEDIINDIEQATQNSKI